MQNYPLSRIPARAHARRPPDTQKPPPNKLLVPMSGGRGTQTTRTTSAQIPIQPDIEDDEQDAQDTRRPAVIGRSALRYRTTSGDEVIQQGNRRMIVTYGKPPRRVHWLVFVGTGMLVMILFWSGLSWFGNWWHTNQVNAQYGYPRIWETDQVLGIDHDSAEHPSHLIFQNLGGHVIFIVIPAGDITRARIYPVTTLYEPDAASIPVTATFADVNHDGRLDILIHLGEQTIVFINTGSQFEPEQ